MKRYLIVQNISVYIIWQKKWWGWKCLRNGSSYISFDTVEAAEKYLQKGNMLHGLYPIVKEITYRTA